jgi:hypothetical protein
MMLLGDVVFVSFPEPQSTSKHVVDEMRTDDTDFGFACTITFSPPSKTHGYSSQHVSCFKSSLLRVQVRDQAR